jgi:hypothetical protein
VTQPSTRGLTEDLHGHETIMSEEGPGIANLYSVVSLQCKVEDHSRARIPLPRRNEEANIPGCAFLERSRNSLPASLGALHRHRRLQETRTSKRTPTYSYYRQCPADVTQHREPLKRAAALAIPVKLALYYRPASTPVEAATLARIDPHLASICQTVNVTNTRASSLAILRLAVLPSARVTSAWPLAVSEPKQGSTKLASGMPASMPCVGRSGGAGETAEMLTS